MSGIPNIVLILADDLGYSDLSCYGGEISTPNLDGLAERGLRFSQFYNTARCSPSRASLLTGLHPHQTGVGVLTHNDGPAGYAGTLSTQCATIPELLGPAGYRCYMSGKWHLSSRFDEGPISEWPLGRGFHRFFGTIQGAGSYYQPRSLWRDDQPADADALDPAFYYTDAISQEAGNMIADHCRTSRDEPFFLYVAYSAPHWPLHARPDDVEKYRGVYDEGWDTLRGRRYERLLELGIIAEKWPMTDRDPRIPPWEEVADKPWECSRMEVYAAQVDSMDQGIGHIAKTLEAVGVLHETMIIFLSDNGGCAEEIREGDGANYAVPSRSSAQLRTRDGKEVHFGNVVTNTPGPENSYMSYGRAWANLSNTPFREYKHWVHEGGIATPFIIDWPAIIEAPGQLRHSPHQLTDILPTVLEAAGSEYPTSLNGRPLLGLEGHSMVPELRGDPRVAEPLFWEHEGNAAVRVGRWKLVRKYPGPWELYDVQEDRTELIDLSGDHPTLTRDLELMYEEWAGRCGVIPRDQILKIVRS